MYDMVMIWSEEDQSFIVKVPSLPGCFADGKTPVQAIAAAEVVIQEWIENAKKYGDRIPKPDYHATADELIEGKYYVG